MGNLKNIFIALLAPLPSLLFYFSFIRHYNHIASDDITDFRTLSALWKWCADHPLLLANAFFFFNVDVIFWVVGLAQSSHWLIDLYWTIIPVLLVHYYATQPLARYDLWRSKIVILLTWIWAIRLTHSYLRREKWQWGAREDWRFTDMSHRCGKHWWWISFFAAYVLQQVLLMGISHPLYDVHSVEKPWNVWDFVAVIVCFSGIIIAYHADTQLHAFVSRNNKLKELGKPVVPTLDEGLWRHSRHPNYIGEQLWWWGLVIFSWKLGRLWSFLGALVNSLCLAYSTVLVENRMLKQDYRAEAYRQYQRTTSVWIPWFAASNKGRKVRRA